MLQRDITKGDTTFLESYRQYGRIINISVTGASKYSPTMLLNYRSAPDVVIWSAVLASSAFPNFLEPQQLIVKHPRTGQLSPYNAYGKAWFDGSVSHRRQTQTLLSR
jgi:predicted acylesterase/phospholipase RssA